MPTTDATAPSSIESSHVAGFDRVTPRVSHTTSAGDLRVDLIEGVRYRFARPVTHDHGHLTEVFRTSWQLTDAPIVQVNTTTTFAGRVRAWGLHLRTIDRLFVLSGAVRIVCYDARIESPTFGRINELRFSDRAQGLVVIPFGIYHGWKNVGDTEAVIVSMPSQLYDHDGPDRYELPWDDPAASEVSPTSGEREAARLDHHPVGCRSIASSRMPSLARRERSEIDSVRDDCRAQPSDRSRQGAARIVREDVRRQHIRQPRPGGSGEPRACACIRGVFADPSRRFGDRAGLDGGATGCSARTSGGGSDRRNGSISERTNAKRRLDLVERRDGLRTVDRTGVARPVSAAPSRRLYRHLLF